jgi:hypothetical protein
MEVERVCVSVRGVERKQEKGDIQGVFDSMKGRESETKRGGGEGEREREEEEKGADKDK